MPRDVIQPNFSFYFISIVNKHDVQLVSSDGSSMKLSRRNAQNLWRYIGDVIL